MNGVERAQLGDLSSRQDPYVAAVCAVAEHGLDMVNNGAIGCRSTRDGPYCTLTGVVRIDVVRYRCPRALREGVGTGRDHRDVIQVRVQMAMRAGCAPCGCAFCALIFPMRSHCALSGPSIGAMTGRH